LIADFRAVILAQTKSTKTDRKLDRHRIAVFNGEESSKQGRQEGETVHEVERIADQAQKMFEGGAWHGPSVLEVLADVDANMAATHPIAGAHSIWELVLHLVATQAILLRRIRGESAGLKTEDFWPAVPPPTESAWADTVARLEQQEAELRHAIRVFPEERLDDRLTAEGSSAYNNFHGHVQHSAYHAGQISLLKKATCLKRDTQ
jgi:uncharacterized damage-inducible protein DinB